jgi:hypothetical protein
MRKLKATKPEVTKTILLEVTWQTYGVLMSVEGKNDA